MHPELEPCSAEPSRGYETWASSPFIKHVNEARSGKGRPRVLLTPPVPPGQLHGFVQAIQASIQVPVIELDLKAILEAQGPPLNQLWLALRGSLFHGPSITMLFLERTRLHAFNRTCGLEALAQCLASFPSSLLIVPGSHLEQQAFADVLSTVDQHWRIHLTESVK